MVYDSNIRLIEKVGQLAVMNSLIWYYTIEDQYQSRPYF
jgi:hypothetical protein